MTKREATRLVFRAEKGYSGPNVTRWYSTVHPKRNREAVVRTWAVKTWKGKPLVMLAAEYNTDGSTAHVSGRCLINNFTHSIAFNWLDYGGNSHVAVWEDVDTCRNEWLEAQNHVFRGGYEFFGRLLNGYEGTKYQWSPISETGLRITDWCDLFRISPRVELIAKAGLRKWLTPRYVRILDKFRLLALHLSHKADEYRSMNPLSVVSRFKKATDGKTAESLTAYIETSRYGLDALPVSFVRVYRWMHRNKVKGGQLVHHIDNLRELNLDLSYEPHVLPHDWAVYSLEIENRVKEAREVAKENERKAVFRGRQEARRIIRRWMDKGVIRKSFSVTIPASETELQLEGNAMRNCVGHYWERLRKGNCDLAFIRKGGKPYIDMEMSGGRIVQMRYKANRAVESGTKDYALCLKVAEAFRRKSA